MLVFTHWALGPTPSYSCLIPREKTVRNVFLYQDRLIQKGWDGSCRVILNAVAIWKLKAEGKDPHDLQESVSFSAWQVAEHCSYFVPKSLMLVNTLASQSTRPGKARRESS